MTLPSRWQPAALWFAPLFASIGFVAPPGDGGTGHSSQNGSHAALPGSARVPSGITQHLSMLEFHGSDTGCDDRAPSEWPYQPDATVPNGEGGREPAWTIDADLAATAVRVVGRARW